MQGASRLHDHYTPLDLTILMILGKSQKRKDVFNHRTPLGSHSSTPIAPSDPPPYNGRSRCQAVILLGAYTGHREWLYMFWYSSGRIHRQSVHSFRYGRLYLPLSALVERGPSPTCLCCTSCKRRWVGILWLRAQHQIFAETFVADIFESCCLLCQHKTSGYLILFSVGYQPSDLSQLICGTNCFFNSKASNLWSK